MNISAGDLREYVSFFSATYPKDEFGAVTRSLGSLFSCWAKVADQASSEDYRTEERGAKEDVTIIIRSSVEVQSLREHHFAEMSPPYGGDAILYEVVSIRQYDGRKDWVAVGLVVPRHNENTA